MALHILVTGGAGYLGSVMCGRLLEAGYRVTVLDSLIYGQTTLFGLCGVKGFEFVRGDVRDEHVVRRLLKGADVVIPLAAIVGAPACGRDPWTSSAVNLGAIEFLDRLRSLDQLVVFPTTNSGYGTQSGEVYCTEETPLQPISRYGQDKTEAERILLDRGRTVTFRIATVFGMSPRMRLDLLVNHFVYAALTEGSILLFEKDFKRNYVHVRDVADAFVHAIENADAMVGRPYNLGLDAANLSKEELAQKIATHISGFQIFSSDVGSDPDKRNYIVSNERLRQVGFEASRSLDQGIEELIRGFSMLPRSPFKNI